MCLADIKQINHKQLEIITCIVDSRHQSQVRYLTWGSFRPSALVLPSICLPLVALEHLTEQTDVDSDKNSHALGKWLMQCHPTKVREPSQGAWVRQASGEPITFCRLGNSCSFF
jgi:hypothetical protein